MAEDNTEGTSNFEDSVETTREVPVDLRLMNAVQLQHEYDTVGSIKKLSGIYQISYRVVRKILTDAGVEIKKPGTVSNAARSEGQRNRWKDPVARQNQSDTLREARQRPEVIKTHRDVVDKRHADPEASKAYHEKLCASYDKNPNRRQQLGDSMKRVWEDPEQRESRIAGMHSEKVMNAQRDPTVIAKKAKQWEDPARREQQRELWFTNVVANMPGQDEFPRAEVNLHHALMQASVSFTTNAVMLSAYAVDILIHQRKLVIEADGTVHLGMQESDAERNEALRAAGYDVVRFLNKDIYDDAEKCVSSLQLEREDNPVFTFQTLKDIMSDLITQVKQRKKMGSDIVRPAVDGKPAEVSGND